MTPAIAGGGTGDRIKLVIVEQRDQLAAMVRRIDRKETDHSFRHIDIVVRFAFFEGQPNIFGDPKRIPKNILPNPLTDDQVLSKMLLFVDPPIYEVFVNRFRKSGFIAGGRIHFTKAIFVTLMVY
jgi:hypothetical protein